MTPSFMRWRTQHDLKRARERFGEFHPATFACYGRAFVAWNGRIRPPAIPDRSPNYEGTSLWNVRRAELASAYTTAQLRAHGDAAHDNRHARKRAARAARAPRPVVLEVIRGREIDKPDRRAAAGDRMPGRRVADRLDAALRRAGARRTA